MKLSTTPLLTFVVLLSRLTYAISQPSDFPNGTTSIIADKEQSSTSLLNQRAEVKYENYTLETLMDLLADATKQFHSAFLRILSDKIPFYQNNDLLNAIFVLKNSTHSISFSDIVFLTAVENFMVVRYIYCRVEMRTLWIEVTTWPDKMCKLHGRIHVTGGTPTSNSVGEFTAHFDEPRLINYYETKNHFIETTPKFKKYSFYYNINVTQSSHRTLVLKWMKKIEKKITTLFRTKMEHTFNEFPRTAPAYNICMNYANHISIKQCTFGSLEKRYYYFVINGIEEAYVIDHPEISLIRVPVNAPLPFPPHKDRLKIDSIHVNGLQPTLLSASWAHKEPNAEKGTVFKWSIGRYSRPTGYANCHHYTRGNVSGISEKLNFTIKEFVILVRLWSNSIEISVDLMKSTVVMQNSTNFSAWAFENLSDMIARSIKDIIGSTLRRRLEAT